MRCQLATVFERRSLKLWSLIPERGSDPQSSRFFHRFSHFTLSCPPNRRRFILPFDLWACGASFGQVNTKTKIADLLGDVSDQDFFCAPIDDGVEKCRGLALTRALTRFTYGGRVFDRVHLAATSLPKVFRCARRPMFRTWYSPSVLTKRSSSAAGIIALLPNEALIRKLPV